ncbi:11149_t:CDS:1, partial [Racocetra fulgida]
TEDSKYFFETQIKKAIYHDANKEYKKAWDIFENLHKKGYTGGPQIYMAKYLLNGFHVELDVKSAYEICDEEKADNLRLQIAKRHHNKKEYEKAWTIFSDIYTCKFRTNHYSSKKSHDTHKHTAKFWMTIYVLEGYYHEIQTEIDINLKFT